MRDDVSGIDGTEETFENFDACKVHRFQNKSLLCAVLKLTKRGGYKQT